MEVETETRSASDLAAAPACADGAMAALDAALVNDALKTVEDLRRRLHTMQDASEESSAAHAVMSDTYMRKCQQRRVTGGADAERGSLFQREVIGPCFYPAATAPVSRLPVLLLNTLLPRYGASSTPSLSAESEKPAWNGVTQLSEPARASTLFHDTNLNRVHLSSHSKRPVRVVFVPEKGVSSSRSRRGRKDADACQSKSGGRPPPTASPLRHAPQLRVSLDVSSPSPATPAAAVRMSAAALALVRDEEIAVRDYLRRMNIISVSPVDDDTKSALHDPLYNGSATARLLLCIFDETAAVAEDAAGPCPCRVRCVQDAERNYAFLHRALAMLHTPPSQGTVAPDAFLPELSVEVCIEGGDPRPMLALLVFLIANYLPPPEELPFSAPLLTCQVPVDVGTDTWPTARSEAANGEALWHAERDVCGFLYTYAALPSPDVHALPGDDCVVPEPLAAPFLSSQPGPQLFSPRRAEPAALYVPSVFPYLRNGVVFAALAQQCVPDALIDDATNAGSIHLNPRTKRSCLANIKWALQRLQRLFLGPNALQDDAMAEMVYRGYRAGIIALLSSIFRCLRSRAQSVERVLERVPPTAVPPQITTRGGSDSGASPVQVQSPSCSDAHRGTSDRLGTSSQRWLATVLGPNVEYTSEDRSFSFSGSQFHEWREPCYIFSDGVLLAQLIAILERGRCPALDCVRPTTKAAAKRFNIGQCLSFLETEKGLPLSIPTVTEGLLAGSLNAVEHVIQTLRRLYKSA